MEKVTYIVDYSQARSKKARTSAEPPQTFATEFVDEARHAFEEGANVLEVREVVWLVGRSRIAINVTTPR